MQSAHDHSGAILHVEKQGFGKSQDKARGGRSPEAEHFVEKTYRSITEPSFS